MHTCLFNSMGENKTLKRNYKNVKSSIFMNKTLLFIFYFYFLLGENKNSFFFNNFLMVKMKNMNKKGKGEIV